MPHFYFPVSELEPLSANQGINQTVTVLHSNHPINLDLVLTFAASTEIYDFSSHEAARKVAALTGPVHAITFRPLVGDPHCWCFGDEMSRDAELRALVKHLHDKSSGLRPLAGRGRG
jgi:hypothetical protein